jgi:serine/threonine-protein kinase
MSVVYKASLLVVRKIVALKLLAPHESLLGLLGIVEIEQRFIAEATRMASCRHINIADVLDFDYAGERLFYTMEYYYQNLGSIIGEGPRADEPSRILSLDRAIHYLGQLLSGLSRLHRMGVVHRDIKPFNLFVTDENTLKISDLGLSKLRGEKEQNPSNLVVGSPFYAAPEQERDPEGVDARADIYAAGVVFYRMLTGMLPEADPVRPSAVHSDVEPLWDDFCLKAIDPDPRNRFGSAYAMLEELGPLRSRWEERKGESCRGLRLSPVAQPHQALGPVVRGNPAKVPRKLAPAVFQCDDLCRPLQYLPHVFEPTDWDGVVLDRATNLLWQTEGSVDPLEWVEAHDYILDLNRRGYGGVSEWRLPTVDELFSLLRPPVHGMEDCLEGVFDRGRKWLWSCDRCTFTTAWYVDAELGFAWWGDLTCRYFVRAVCCRSTDTTIARPASESSIL